MQRVDISPKLSAVWKFVDGKRSWAVVWNINQNIMDVFHTYTNNTA